MAMQKKCYILVGVSGVGKSTWTSQLVKSAEADGTKCGVFSLDQVRLDCYARSEALLTAHTDESTTYAKAFEYVNSHKNEFDQAVNAAWYNTLNNCDIVVVDNTNLTRKSRNRWIQDARKKGFQICGVEFFAPLSVLLARQTTRGDKIIPEDVVRTMYMSQQSLLLGSEVDMLELVTSF